MQVFEDWRGLPASARGAAVAIGNFDGVHRGHAHLVRAAHAALPGAARAVLTFEPPPRRLFRPDDPPFRLTLPGERAAALGALGIGMIYQLRFDADFAALDPEGFVRQVLHEGLGAAHLATGPDFAFGHRRAGDVARLGQLAEGCGIGMTVVPKLADAQGPLSSTRIRRALQDGYPERAAEELGRAWRITGVVQPGDRRGRTLGFATANIPLGDHLEPARGVYAVRVVLAGGEVHAGVANIGRRPTVNAGEASRVEAHIFDFDRDIYGADIGVELLSYLRPERKFGSLDALREQIAEDARAARTALAGVAA